MRTLSLFAGLALIAVAPPAVAQQLTYQPTNPAFGGSPLNYNWMLQSAQLQNQFKEEDKDRFFRDPLVEFEQSLQRQILNQLGRELISDRFGDLDLTQPGTFNLGDFLIEVVPGLDGVSIRVFNLLTGEETVVTVPNGF
ncbi:curli production assembly/transport component CsgF [Rubrivirga sp. IMCC43871]|uniref:curli production assembly/transport component CsgF n=1 Tax=Rubrivirga sp. IMCC43871 TaxID=3391575 RepID=UPI003990202D